VPEDYLGHGRLSRAEDGSIVMEGELIEEALLLKEGATLAAGVIVHSGDYRLNRNGSQPISASELISVALTWRHSDPSQPVIRLVDE
jgi:hypothetical protein